MNDATLTEQQLAHAQAFDVRTPDLDEIDFDRYHKPPFGPWNPYWRVFDLVAGRLSDSCRRLLIVGCGNGRDALIYARLGYEVHGFDISPGAIAIAQKAAERHGLQDSARFSVQPAEATSYDADYFDLVLGVNVLHHM
ncbi:MAG: class I SAM-dependent methyltransferase, partial [Planctomycetaceae bacterium]|nr:class I SAM-dependent methyltransferase [Planctomycetaceae bacterium]